MNACPVCQSQKLVDTITIDAVPIYCNVLSPDPDHALAVRKGDILLSCCEDCGHVFNRNFDPGLMDYSEEYENSLHYSPQFSRYAEDLAERLVDQYQLHSRTIIEIGCGKGDFLSLLCEKGNNRGFGFDRSVEQERATSNTSADITFVNDFYDEKYADHKADFIVCRHVLEHIDHPVPFLEKIRANLEEQPDTVLYFEVPNVLYTLKDMGIWDLIYEHCAYFSPDSLETVFRNAGFDVLALGESFGGQFLYIEAKARPAGAAPAAGNGNDLAALLDYVRAFNENYQSKVTDWTEKLDAIRQSGKSAVIWGGGSKGVTFLNVVPTANAIEYVVDLNPHKHAMHAPGGGQKIVAPDFLRDYLPDLVIVMNGIYKDEISRSLADMGVQAEVLSV